MIHLKSFEFSYFGTNTYVLNDDEGNALLVDPACSSPYEQRVLEVYLNPFHVRAILATHGHLDHLWGAKWATDKWQMPVLMHEADIPMAQAMQMQYNLFGIQATPQPFPMEPFPSSSLPLYGGAGGGFSFIGELGGVLLHTPGHTPGSVCFYWPEEQLLLSGDTLFNNGYGRTDLPGGNIGQLIQSLTSLCKLPAETKVYPGHGESTTIGDCARFFR